MLDVLKYAIQESVIGTECRGVTLQRPHSKCIHKIINIYTPLLK